MMGLGSPALDSAYDIWKTTPPEDRESNLKCVECKDEIYPGERIYRLEDEVYCRDCAREWLENHSEEATEDMCYKE